MPFGRAAQSPFRIITQELIGDSIPKAKLAFSFHARLVVGATIVRPSQHNLPVK